MASKPQGTKVKIRKTTDRLDLIVPRKQAFSRAAIHQIVFTAALDLAALALTVISLWLSFQINHLTNAANTDQRGSIVALVIGLLLVLPLTFWLLGAAAKNSIEMCKQLFSDTSVSIDQKHIALSTQFYNFDWGTIRRIKVKDVSRVIITDFQYIDGNRQVKAPCYLVLETNQYGSVNLLAAEHRLSRAEATWLGKEISRWLGIELGSD